MARTHDLPGGGFFHFIRVRRDTPLHHRAATIEVDAPFRRSDSHIIRLKPSRFALVAGKWYPSDLNEDQALLAALRGRGDALPVVDEEGHITEQFDSLDSGEPA